MESSMEVKSRQPGPTHPGQLADLFFIAVDPTAFPPGQPYVFIRL
jgi:hypothetical protein